MTLPSALAFTAFFFATFVFFTFFAFGTCPERGRRAFFTAFFAAFLFAFFGAFLLRTFFVFFAAFFFVTIGGGGRANSNYSFRALRCKCIYTAPASGCSAVGSAQRSGRSGPGVESLH